MQDIVRYLVLDVIPGSWFRLVESIACVHTAFVDLPHLFIARNKLKNKRREVLETITGSSRRRTKLAYGQTLYDHFVYKFGAQQWQTLHVPINGYAITVFYDYGPNGPVCRSITIANSAGAVIAKNPQTAPDGIAPATYKKLMKAIKSPPNQARKLLVKILW